MGITDTYLLYKAVVGMSVSFCEYSVKIISPKEENKNGDMSGVLLPLASLCTTLPP